MLTAARDLLPHPLIVVTLNQEERMLVKEVGERMRTKDRNDLFELLGGRLKGKVTLVLGHKRNMDAGMLRKTRQK